MNRGDKVFINAYTPQGEKWIEWEVFADYQDGTFMADNYQYGPRIFRTSDIMQYVPKEVD